MNAREGMRRLGLALGIVGAAISTVSFSYPTLRDLERRRDRHNEVERLRSPVAAQRKITVTQEAASYPWEYAVTKSRDGELTITHSKDIVRKARPSGDGGVIFADETADEKAMPRLVITSPITGEVALVRWGVDKPPTREEASTILDRQREDQINERKVYDQGAPPFSKYLAPLIFPLLCFLIPWGIMKTITWIGAGFFSGSAKGA